MSERLGEKIRGLVETHNNLPVASKFLASLEREGLTRDENPKHHYCVYFAACDPTAGELFIGHHKKSDLWIFNGGHIDKGEIPEETLLREMGEEWGLKIGLEQIGSPKLLTITKIDNRPIQACRTHYDIWYFVPVEKATFKPDEVLLSKEFHQTEWFVPEKARKFVTDSNTLAAISMIEEDFR